MAFAFSVQVDVSEVRPGGKVWYTFVPFCKHCNTYPCCVSSAGIVKYWHWCVDLHCILFLGCVSVLKVLRKLSAKSGNSCLLQCSAHFPMTLEGVGRSPIWVCNGVPPTPMPELGPEHLLSSADIFCMCRDVAAQVW